MRIIHSSWALAIVAGSLAATGCNDARDGGREGSTSDAVKGAVYTTFDDAQGGCKNSDNGINCNHYASKDDVYISGGPAKAGLGDGTYYFAVLTPGSQNGGFVDGAKGNLSDTTAGKKGDHGSGDAVDNRTFVVEGGAIVSYQGTHQTGTSPNGKLVIQLMPFDDTSNNGGVYILAVCEVGATSPSQCKFDAFKVKDKDKDKDDDDCGDDGDCGGDDDDCGDDGDCGDDDDCGGDDGDCGGDDDDCGDDGGCDDECGSDDCDDGCDGGCEPPAPYCGDGTTDAGEGCDDGNTSDGDGCSANCTIEVPEPCCGDGAVDAGEGCDDGNLTSGDGCSADCQVEPSMDCSPCE